MSRILESDSENDFLVSNLRRSGRTRKVIQNYYEPDSQEVRLIILKSIHIDKSQKRIDKSHKIIISTKKGNQSFLPDQI